MSAWLLVVGGLLFLAGLGVGIWVGVSCEAMRLGDPDDWYL